MPSPQADQDLIKGVLTNLLENAAHAAGPGGVVLGKTAVQNGKVAIEVHDSGPGLSTHAKATLFEPTISFKKDRYGAGAFDRETKRRTAVRRSRGGGWGTRRRRFPCNPAPRYRYHQSFMPKRIIVVDDEINIGRSLQMILEREGYAVTAFQSTADFGRSKAAADAYLA